MVQTGKTDQAWPKHGPAVRLEVTHRQEWLMCQTEEWVKTYDDRWSKLFCSPKFLTDSINLRFSARFLQEYEVEVGGNGSA